MLVCGGCGESSRGLGISGGGTGETGGMAIGTGWGAIAGLGGVAGAGGEGTDAGGASARDAPEATAFSMAAKCRSRMASRSFSWLSGNVRNCSVKRWTRAKAEIARIGVTMTRITARTASNSMVKEIRANELDHSYDLHTIQRVREVPPGIICGVSHAASRF